MKTATPTSKSRCLTTLVSVKPSTTLSLLPGVIGRSCKNRRGSGDSQLRSLAGHGSWCHPLSNRRRPDLQRQARDFAVEISTALNGTVTDGVRLSVFMNASGRAVIGYRANKNSPLGEPIVLTVSRAPGRLCLDVLHTLDLDESGEFLTTNKSTYTLKEIDSNTPIATYDYTRDPPNEYPEAHFHLHGESDAMRSMLTRCNRGSDKPSDLHFPVGGRRFRPCLEDLIEFCILERLVTPREGWQESLEESRDRYRERQLRAAVRRYPAQAAQVLRRGGWDVKEPDDLAS